MRILSERQQEALSGDVSWLDHLIEEERVGGAVAGPGSRARDMGRSPSHPRKKLVPLVSASQLQRPASGA
jgi:hypothetical protein